MKFDNLIKPSEGQSLFEFEQRNIVPNQSFMNATPGVFIIRLTKYSYTRENKFLCTQLSILGHWKREQNLGHDYINVRDDQSENNFLERFV